MSYELETIDALPDADFRRLLGVKRATYAAMLAELERRQAAKKKTGRPPVLTLEQQLALTLQFWRFVPHALPPGGRAARAGEHGAPHHRAGENTLVKSDAFALPAQARAGGADQPWEVVIVDVTE